MHLKRERVKTLLNVNAIALFISWPPHWLLGEMESLLPNASTWHQTEINIKRTHCGTRRS